jgi:hypothetical protein
MPLSSKSVFTFSSVALLGSELRNATPIIAASKLETSVLVKVQRRFTEYTVTTEHLLRFYPLYHLPVRFAAFPSCLVAIQYENVLGIHVAFANGTR